MKAERPPGDYSNHVEDVPTAAIAEPTSAASCRMKPYHHPYGFML